MRSFPQPKKYPKKKTSFFGRQSQFFTSLYLCSLETDIRSLSYTQHTVMLQVLYKVKTAKIFEKSKQAKSLNGDDEPFAIQLITMCKESKVLAVVGASSHIILFRFSKIEVSTELSVSSTRASKRAGGGSLIFQNCSVARIH